MFESESLCMFNLLRWSYFMVKAVQPLSNMEVYLNDEIIPASRKSLLSSSWWAHHLLTCDAQCYVQRSLSLNSPVWQNLYSTSKVLVELTDSHCRAINYCGPLILKNAGKKWRVHQAMWIVIYGTITFQLISQIQTISSIMYY